VSGFDAIHASPPCQGHSALKSMHNAKFHADLVPATRAKLIASGLPYIIENVVGAPIRNPTILCGTMFALGVDDAELWRHRLFETSFPPMLPPVCQHGERSRVIGVYGGHGRDRRRIAGTQDFTTQQRREAMGIDWMSGTELSQAVPPAFTEYLGNRLMVEVLSQMELAA
jgi:DNA (cytosine-5)-methyltransferase 1